MIHIQRTIVETYTIPPSVFRRRLGIGGGVLVAEIKQNGQVADTPLVRWVDDGSAVVLKVTRQEHESRRNR